MKIAEVDLENLAETAKVSCSFGIVWEGRGCWMFLVSFWGVEKGQLLLGSMLNLKPPGKRRFRT